MTTAIATSGRRLTRVRQELKRANAAFRRLTRAQQRVRIAKDVILQIKSEAIQAESTYLRCNEIRDLGAVAANLELSEVLCQTDCAVCGIGSLFVAAVKRVDKLPLNEFMVNRGRDVEVDYLSKWFSPEQCDLVEAYYEWRVDGDRWNEAGDTLTTIRPIVVESDNNKRLIMIMENIISNNGKFNPLRGAHKNARGVPAMQ